MTRHVTFDYERVLTPIGFVWVPVVRVQLRHGRKTLELDMTVDSGADLDVIMAVSCAYKRPLCTTLS